MVASTTRSQLRKCLNDVDFQTYNNVGQVAASVTIADEGDDERGAKAGAESPIVEELGENRGS
jgi:hypothetical protein